MTITSNFKDFAYGTVQTAPSPTDTGTSLTLHSGQGNDFPAAPFDVTMWPPDVNPLSSNAEIGICTEKDGDVLHITRHSRGTTAQHVLAGWQVMNCIDAELLNEIIALASGADGDILDQVIVSSFSTGCGPQDSMVVNGADIEPICSPDGDGTNPFHVTFEAPASGVVELWAEMEIFVEMFNLPSGLAWCFTDAETGETPVSPLQEVNVFADVFGDAEIDTYTRAIYHAFVRDLTPGQTYNWQLSGFTLSGSAAVDIRVNDGTDPETPWGPAVVTVQGGGVGGGGDGGGSGLESVVAGDNITIDDTDPLNPVISATGGGGGGGGGEEVTFFPAIHVTKDISFDTEDLLTGVLVYDAQEDDAIINIWVEIHQNFDGTTPMIDVGTFDESDGGFFTNETAGPIDATNEDTASNGVAYRGWGPPPYSADLASQNDAYLHTTGNQGRIAPFRMTNSVPIKVCLSQNGTNDGDDPGCTQGSATVHVLVCPAAGITVGGSGGGSGIGGILPVQVVALGNTEVTDSPPSGAANVDGYDVVTGWRVLLTDQDNSADDGIWVANTAGVWTRPDDFASASTIPDGTLIPVGDLDGNYYYSDIWQTSGTMVVDSGSGGQFLLLVSAEAFQYTPSHGGPPSISIPGNLSLNGVVVAGNLLIITAGLIMDSDVINTTDQSIDPTEPVVLLLAGTVDPVLPVAAGNAGVMFWIKNQSGGSVTLNPDPGVPDTIEGAATLVLADGDAVQLWGDAANNGWAIMASHGL